MSHVVLHRSSCAQSIDPDGPYASEVLGLPTTLTRSGMQDNIAATPMHDIWEEAAFPVCRVEIYYEELGGCYADCDGNDVLDIFDFICFQDAFLKGCP